MTAPGGVVAGEGGGGGGCGDGGVGEDRLEHKVATISSWRFLIQFKEAD